MSGQWIEDPNSRSGWRWDESAPSGDPAVTHLMSRYAGGGPVTSDEYYHSFRDPNRSADPIPSSPDVLDRSIGSDGGGPVYRTGESGYAALSGTPQAPFGWELDADDYTVTRPGEHDPLDHDPGLPPNIVTCPACGTAVDADRIRD